MRVDSEVGVDAGRVQCKDNVTRDADQVKRRCRAWGGEVGMVSRGPAREVRKNSMHMKRRYGRWQRRWNHVGGLGVGSSGAGSSM